MTNHWSSIEVLEEDDQGQLVWQPERVFGQQSWLSEKPSYSQMRFSHMGDYGTVPPPAYPPYNPTGVPQVSFAFIDACESGRDDFFIHILYPFRIYSFSEVTNQAVLTWNGFSSLQRAERMNDELWSRLASKMTIEQALVDMIEENASLSRSNQWFIIQDTSGGSWRQVSSLDDVPILGDPYTRIHGVYTGNNSLPTTHPDWWL